MNLISFCLYGRDDLYVKGFCENVDIATRVYPEWKIVLHTTRESLDEVAKHTDSNDFRAIVYPSMNGHTGMFARFLTAADPTADRVLFRDTDSRLNWREAEATHAWVESGKDFQILRDHADHANWPILGGMWGVRAGVLPNIEKRMADWASRSKDPTAKMADMRFLAEEVWPIATKSMVHFSSVPTPHGEAVPFPKHYPYVGYCGEIVPVSVPQWS